MADLFGGSNLLSHPPFLPRAEGLSMLASALLGGAGASWQSGMANALPKARGEGGTSQVGAPAEQNEMNGPAQPTFGPDVPVGTNTSTQPAWMGGESSTWNVSPVALAAAPYTGGVSMATASPVIQDAPAFGYVEPTKRNWDGTTVNGPAWMQSAPQKNYVARDAAELADMAFAAQDSTELQKLAAANSDWMKFGGVQKIFKQADQLIGNAEMERQRIANRTHQSNMEKLTERARNAQVAGLNGIGKVNESIISDFDYIAQHGSPEHVALATDFLDREKYPQSQVSDGIFSANPQSIIGLSRLKQSIIDAKAKESGLIPTQINPKGEVTMGLPKSEKEGGGEPITVVQPDGTKLYYRPGGTGLHVESARGDRLTPTAAQQFHMGEKLIEMGDPEFSAAGTNLIRSAIKGGFRGGVPTLPTITSKSAFDALSKGAHYIGKDGKEYVKP